MKITLLTGRTFDFSAHFGFEIKVRKSALAKRLTLRIDEKQRCPVLTLPKRCSQKQAISFLEANRDWITNMLARLPKKSGFTNGESISFFGESFIIEQNPTYKGAFFENGVLKLGGQEEFLHRRVVDFLKKQTLQRLSEMSLTKAKEINCHLCSVSIKDTKSRWGSCSTKANINYNWRICLAPLDVIDYLVSHEVSHLLHPDHSTAFWQTVETLCPNYKDSRHWLKIKGKDLYKYL